MQRFDKGVNQLLKVYLGIDLGSVSTNFIVLSQEGEVLINLYLVLTSNPIQAVRSGLE